MFKSSLIFFLLSCFLALKGQNLHYEIIKGDTQIGYLEVTNYQKGDVEVFSIKNIVNFKVLFTFSVEYVLTESFQDGVLVSGDGYNSLNGTVDRRTSIEMTPSGYSLIINGISASPEKKPIYESVSQIYHREPYPDKPIYSQYFGRYLTAEKVGDHEYRVVSADGENIYSYTNGYCREVKVSRDFATIYIRMTPESWAQISKK